MKWEERGGVFKKKNEQEKGFSALCESASQNVIKVFEAEPMKADRDCEVKVTFHLQWKRILNGAHSRCKPFPFLFLFYFS